MDDVELGARGRAVLRALVAEYLRQGAPVSSQKIAQLPSIAASPATVRAIMANLESQGLLVSPHSSAGRLPSARGLRFFVNNMLTVMPPSSQTIMDIRDGVQGDNAGEVLDASARTISKLTQYAGFIVVSPQAAARVRRLQFIKLASRRLLAVMEMTEGDVINRMFDCDDDISDAALDAAARFYNEKFSDVPVAQAREQLQHQVFDLHAQIADLLRRMLDKTQESAPSQDADLRVFGKTNLAAPDIAGDIGKLQGLYDLLRRKRELLQLLQSSAGGDDVRLFIGSECGFDEMDDCSVVFAACDDRNKPVGIVGVIGPKRMRYNRIIPTVAAAARAVEQTLSARGGRAAQ